MKKNLTLTLVLLCCYGLYAQNNKQPNPFESIGKAPKKILTLSDGKYQEFFYNDTLRRVGSVMFNTVTGKVAYFIDRDSISSEDVDRSALVSRWLSQDPLAAKYPSMSPYNFTGNNPIQFIDADGRVIVDPANGRTVERVGGEWKTVVSIDDKGVKTYGAVSKKFDKLTKPILTHLNSSGIGKETIEKLMSHNTKIGLTKMNGSGAASLVSPGANIIAKNPELLSESGELKQAEIWFNIKGAEKVTSKKADLNMAEYVAAVMQVELGHLDATQMAVEVGFGSSSFYALKGDAQRTVFEPLFNNFVSAIIAYREEKGIALNDDVFRKVIKDGWTLNEENQKHYDAYQAAKGKGEDYVPGQKSEDKQKKND